MDVIFSIQNLEFQYHECGGQEKQKGCSKEQNPPFSTFKMITQTGPQAASSLQGLPSSSYKVLAFLCENGPCRLWISTTGSHLVVLSGRLLLVKEVCHRRQRSSAYSLTLFSVCFLCGTRRELSASCVCHPACLCCYALYGHAQEFQAYTVQDEEPLINFLMQSHYRNQKKKKN